MSARPRPRPRPRPIAHTPAPAPTPSSPGPSTLTSPPPERSPVDEDELFFRNRTRTAQTWKNLDKIAAEKELHRRVSSDAEDDSDEAPHKHRRATKDEVPKWTKMSSKDAIMLLSSDDEVDEEILRRVEKATPRKCDTSPGQKRIIKRQRSRSRSLTPPPALPQAALQIAREKVRQLVGEVPRAPSPIYLEEDSADTDVLDEELASLARQIKARSQSTFNEDAPADRGGPEIVIVKVRWIPHPLNPSGKASVWGFKVKRHDAFQQLFDETADAAEVISDHLIMTHNGTRVFPSATPHSVGVWAEAELEVCDKKTYEYLLANRRDRSPSQLPRDRSPSHAHSPSPAPYESDAESAAESTTEDDKFRLTVRSAKAKDVVLTVRPTTTCGAIVKAFLKKAGLAEQYAAGSAPPAKKGRKGKHAPPAGAYLVVDGDRMDAAAEIGTADLEDGDLVEVAGL